jgi:hypothetical protein
MREEEKIGEGRINHDNARNNFWKYFDLAAETI